MIIFKVLDFFNTHSGEKNAQSRLYTKYLLYYAYKPFNTQFFKDLYIYLLKYVYFENKID